MSQNFFPRIGRAGRFRFQPRILHVTDDVIHHWRA